MKKTICILFLFFALTFCFADVACAENVSYLETNAFRVARRAQNTGKIELSYSFPINSQELELLQFTPSEINTFKFYLTTYVNALSKTYKQKEIEGCSVGGVVFFADVDGLGFTITFDNLNAQQKFFGSENNEDNNTSTSSKTISSGFFVKKTKIQSSFVFSSESSAENFKRVCTLAVEAWCENSHMSSDKKQAVLDIFDEGVYIYDFATQNTGLMSECMYDDGTYSHNVFIKSTEDIKSDNTITFWVTSPNRAVWYASAVVVVFAGMLVAYIMLKKRGKV
ncbi:MAG: hypothetical protein ACI4R8_05095 [Candidatus Caccovivens sp.]